MKELSNNQKHKNLSKQNLLESETQFKTIYMGSSNNRTLIRVLTATTNNIDIRDFLCYKNYKIVNTL